MSCNGCRVLRKGCSDTCILRSCLQWIESPEAQGHATVFVAKFFGRAGMLSFISAVAESQRPALFQSLLYEACGRTVNPVFGAVGLLWSGNWAVCQAAVETVLKGGSLKPMACPPSTKPLYKSHGNPSSKRPHSMTEASMSFNAEAKRLRLSDWHAEPLELGCNADVAHVDPVFSPDSDVNTSRNPGFLGNSEAFKQEQSPPPSHCDGQLVAPVARRVKPQGGYFGIVAMVVREHQQASSQEQETQSHDDTVELDLSLNSHAHTNANAKMSEMLDDGKARSNADHYDGESHVDHHIAFESNLCNEEELASFVEVGRASSPCSLSMNSEGSVTSVDSAEFSISGVRAFSARTSRHDDCQLLHLL